MILLDTNVLSELMKPAPDEKVDRWLLLNDSDCCLPSIALGEISCGIAKLPESSRKSRYWLQLAEWRIQFADRIYPFTAETASMYGEVLAKARRAGRPMSVPDGQIAAMALEWDCALATRNISDFETTGLRLINPWD